MNAHPRQIFHCRIWSGAILRICLDRRRPRDCSRPMELRKDASVAVHKCVYPWMPMESAISARGLPRASSSSKLNSTGALPPALRGGSPPRWSHLAAGSAHRGERDGANDPSSGRRRLRATNQSASQIRSVDRVIRPHLQCEPRSGRKPA